MYTSEQNLVICPFDANIPKPVVPKSISKSSIRSASVKLDNSNRRKSLGQSIGRFISKKLTKRSKPKIVKLTKITHAGQKRGLQRNSSIKSVDFWEEEWATIKKRRSSSTTAPHEN